MRAPGRALMAGGASGPWQLAMTDDELEAMDKRRRSCFRDELRKRHPSLTPMDDETARSLVKDVMLMIGIAPPGEHISDRSLVHALMATASRLSQNLVCVFGPGVPRLRQTKRDSKRQNTWER